MSSDSTRTLTRSDYCSPEIYEIERRLFFHGGWFLALRADTLRPGNRTVVDVAGESILVTRDLDGVLHAFANVCRHRGARLCDEHSDTSQGSLMCPYHAWTYALDGRLIATPHLDGGEVDKDTMSLWSVALHVWQGFVFISLAKEPPAFDDWVAQHGQELVSLERFHLEDLQVAVRTVAEVEANWKVIVENYQECLHCTRVHPELVELIPTYRSGWVSDPARPDGGVALVSGKQGLAVAGRSSLPTLPGLDDVDAASYYGCTMFPNAFVDISGNAAIVSYLYPKGPTHTTMVMEYMFAPDTIADPEFDPSSVVEFNELVAAQDNLVCERVQQGVSSSLFEGGVLTPKDAFVIGFVQHYLEARGPVD
ncbi:MAG: aromatic ring-hydroxylating dioxygenase subunit alpha [Ilumatobacteraceae bacterium]